MHEAITYPHVDTLLFFGSFDPFTIGHEALVRAGIEAAKPSKVLIIPAAAQGWGKKLSSFEDRESMIMLAAGSIPEWKGMVEVSDVEQTNHLSGITADTLHFLLDHKLVSGNPGFLMGADWIISFPTWEEWEWMLSVAPAFVALRGEETQETLVAQLMPAVLPYLKKRVFFLPEEGTLHSRAISSTGVRNDVKKRAHTDHIAPQVRDWIERQNLYQAP